MCMIIMEHFLRIIIAKIKILNLSIPILIFESLPTPLVPTKGTMAIIRSLPISADKDTAGNC